MWAAVVNTAVSMYQEDHGLPVIEGEFLNLPSWIPEQEQCQIERHIHTWAARLLDSGLDFSSVGETLAKPLRCVWVGHDAKEKISRSDLPSDYLPIVLISASISTVRNRQKLPTKYGDGSVEIMFDYVPGAGDDEESWARGLTPNVMWNAVNELLLAGPENIYGTVKHLVRHTSDETRNSTLYLDQSLNSRVSWIGSTGMGLASLEYIQKKEFENVAFINLTMHDIGSLVQQKSCEVEKTMMIGSGGLNSKDEDVYRLNTKAATITPYLWLHPQTWAHQYKSPIISWAPVCIEFCSHHLQKGKNIILIFDSGSSAAFAAGIVLCALIACFELRHEDSGSEKDCLKWHSQYQLDVEQRCIRAAAQPKFSREKMRQYVANSIAKYTPSIIIRKSLLKQVFNVFMPSVK